MKKILMLGLAGFSAVTTFGATKSRVLDCKEDKGALITYFDPSAVFKTKPMAAPKPGEGTKKYALFADALVIIESDGKLLPPDLKQNTYSKLSADTRIYYSVASDQQGALLESIHLIDWKEGKAKLQKVLVTKDGTVITPYSCLVTERS